MTATAEQLLAAPDLTVSARQLFGIDSDMEVPAFSEANERVTTLAARRDAKTGLLEAERRDLADGGVVFHEKHVLIHRE